MKHKVLFLSNHPSPHMADLFRAICRHPRMCLKVLFASLEDPERSWQHDLRGFPNKVLPRIPIGTRLPLNPVAVKEILHYVRRGYVPIICVYTMPTSLLSMLVLISVHKPWLLLGEAPGQDYRGGRVKATLRDASVRRLLNMSSGALAISRNGVKQYGQLRSSARIAHFQYYEAAQEFRAIARNGLAGRKAPSFLMCGMLCHRKGPQLALQASEILLRKDLAHGLVFVGDGELRTELEEYCHINRLAHVEFRGQVGWRSRHDAFRDADVLIHPTRFDGWGMVVPEGLAAGMPVVTTESCGAGVDLIEDGRNGFLLGNPLSAELLAESMAYFVHHPTEIRRMGRLARESVEGWTPEAGAKRLCEVLDDWFSR